MPKRTSLPSMLPPIPEALRPVVPDGLGPIADRNSGDEQDAITARIAQP